MIGTIAIVVFLGCLTPTIYSSFFSLEIEHLSINGLFPLAFLWAIATDWTQLIAWDGWKTVNSEDQLIHHLLWRNTTHLSMSGNTPLATGPLADAIGLEGDYPLVDDILQGVADIDQYTTHLPLSSSERSPAMKSFINALQRPISTTTGLPIPEISPELTLNEYKSLFSKTKEKTASFPPIHYGHYKAACESDLLATVNLTFMNLPFKHGFPLSRWERSIHCMIQKKPLPYITKLRIVQLYEADFNSYLKFILGRRLSNHAIQHGVADRQLYATKGSSAQDALITARLMYDMTRLNRENLVSILNDLKGNYDRVRPGLNTITTRRIGLPKGPAVCHALALRLMKHFIRTGYGISELYILWSLTQNLGGLGQGNGAGPISWHSHMLPLIKAYEDMVGDAVTFVSPDKTRNFKKWLIGYVDDNTIFAKMNDVKFNPHAASELIRIAKGCLEAWQELIHITGGELEIDKSCLTLMTWKPAHGREILETVSESRGDLSIRSVKYPGLQVLLNRNEVSKGERILGVRLALDGNDRDEFAYRLTQAKDLAGRIRSAPFSREDAEVIYRERWLPSVGYCLPITQFSIKQCQKIQIPFYQAILPKMGFNRHIPTAVRFGPKKYNGKGLADFATQQHIQHLERFCGHIRRQKEIGNLLQIEMDTIQLIMGSRHHFFQLDPSIYCYGEKSFVQYLWEHNYNNNITIHLHDPWRIQPARENDLFIMDEMIKKVTKMDVLCRMNDVRLFLQVTRLSDISVESGDALDLSILNGTPKPNCLTWPKRRVPLEENLKQFRMIIRSMFGGMYGLFPRNLGDPTTFTSSKYNTDNINSFLESYDTQYRSLLGSFCLSPTDYTTILSWLKHGVLYAGSDGSVGDSLGAHAFGFTNGSCHSSIIGGSAPTPGNLSEMTSLRTELAGAIAILLVLYAFQEVTSSTFPLITIWIDNLETLRRQQTPLANQTWRDMFALDFDLWHVLLEVQTWIKSPLKWEKVDSHVDQRAPSSRSPKGNDLAWRLNEVMDTWANGEREVMTGPPDEVFFPASKIMISSGDSMVYGKIGPRIEQDIMAPPSLHTF